jgi:hypothetical protein
MWAARVREKRHGISDPDTFTDSLARLTGDEQKAVETTAFDLQLRRPSKSSFRRL